MCKKYLFSFLLISIFNGLLFSQEYETIIPLKNSFGIDTDHKLIVWNYKVTDSLKKAHSNFSITFNRKHTFDIASDSLSYTKSYKDKNGYLLYITKLPVVSIAIKDSIINDPKKAAQFSFFHKEQSLENTVGIELRGNISLSFPKKSYDLKFWKDEKGKESIKVKFRKLRTDDDWTLDGLFNEPLRLRSYIASKLWLSMHPSHYVKIEPKAKSGIDMRFVEVFLNSKYIGLYTLTEKVDRDLLKLKKFEDKRPRGELFKATSYEGAPAFKKAPEFKNIFPHWAGYRMIYPIIDYKYHWDDLHAFTNFVINSKDVEFMSEIDKRVQLENTIDYFLLVNMLRATDNLGKNFYIAKYDKDSPYFIVPWDLDGIWGIIIDGRRIATTDDILSNGLFDKLIQENPNEYKRKLANRWQVLRNTLFSNKELMEQIDKLYITFKKNKVYEREHIIWPSTETSDQHFVYLKSWLDKRLTYLDNFFSELKE